MINIKIQKFELSSQQVVTCSKSTVETTEKSYEVYSKLTIKTPEQCQWLRFSVFIVDLEYILHFLLVFTVDFEQLFAGWSWTINVQLQWKLFKADTYGTKTRCPL